MKILLGQLGANGDCLYATILACQIKQDYPGCHLTWAVSSQSRQVLHRNPYVDDIWECNTPSVLELESAWQGLETAVLRIQTGRDPFDKVVLSQIWPNNFRNFDGTVRPSILRSYDRPITTQIDSVIVLSDEELDHVEQFVRFNRVDQYSHRILFECSSKSGQSYVTPAFALRVARQVSHQLDDCCFVISSCDRVGSDLRNVFSAHELMVRENAALTHHCSLFVGCGSGLTVAATSGAAKELPNIQLLTARTSVYASFFHDFEYWGKPSGRFIEMGNASEDTVADAIVMCCRNGVPAAREAYHRPLPLTFNFYLETIEHWLVQRCRYLDALESLVITCRRYGWNKQLLDYARKKIIPLARFDSLCISPANRKRLQTNIDLVLDHNQ